MKDKTYLILFLIIFLACCFRFSNLDENPAGLFRDEAEKGYTAYSLVKTGGYVSMLPTQFGSVFTFHRLPLFINVYGVHTSALYQYAAVPFVALLGLSEVSVRAPAALCGGITVLLTFFLCARFISDRVGLLSAFLLAVSPWHVMFSRWAQQGIFIPLFLTVGTLLFLSGLREKKTIRLILAAIPFALGVYGYAIARAFIPIFLLGLFVIHSKSIAENKKGFIAFICALIVLCFPTLHFVLFRSAKSAARFNRISIFSGDGSALTIGVHFVRNYVLHYTGRFLFIDGDEQLRHSVRNFGVMHYFEIPMFLVGLVALFRKRDFFSKTLLLWFFTFPIPASLTREGIPHALRTITALPMMHIISAIGGISLYDAVCAFHRGEFSFRRIPAKIIPSPQMLRALAGVVAIFCIGIFAVELFIFYPNYSASSWQYGVKESVEFSAPLIEEGYDVFVSGYITQAPYLYLFYTGYSPEEFKKHNFENFPYKFLPYGFDLERKLGAMKKDKFVTISSPGEIKNPPPTKTIFAPTNPISDATYRCLEIHLF